LRVQMNSCNDLNQQQLRYSNNYKRSGNFHLAQPKSRVNLNEQISDANVALHSQRQENFPPHGTQMLHTHASE